MNRARLFALFLLSLLSSAPAWGHDDLCVFRKGLFLCDTAHDGGTAETRFRFGQAGDVPFLVRSSVDGPAQPCVFRGQSFLCKVGGTQPLGVPSGAQPLMGDVDGDLADGGAVDPCYRSGKRWTCLVWSLNGYHQTSWDFGAATAPGLLGDVDGDGLADSCVFRSGRFSCRMYRSQTGRYIYVDFDLTKQLHALGGGKPLLGDLDGDGRAAPCLYGHGRLVCGFFPATGGLPARTQEWSFGVEGDVPVIGDVDGQ
jgi:hypothetical protein